MSNKRLPTYVFSMDKVASVVAANNYMSIFNPVTNPHFLAVGGFFISAVLLNPSSVVDSFRGWRITTATGGTLQDDAAVGKIQSHFPDPTAELRTGNPTCTMGAALFNVPAPVENKAAPAQIISLGEAGPLILTPGEGVVLRTEAAAGAGGTWNFSVVWAEGP